jgi:hypothetical protein
MAGDVSKPIKGKITAFDINAAGYLYLRLPPGPSNACPPSQLTAQSLTAALASSKFAALPGRPGVSFRPPVITSLVVNPANNKVRRRWPCGSEGGGVDCAERGSHWVGQGGVG